jgi:uncharacterized protein (DUF1778 family)
MSEDLPARADRIALESAEFDRFVAALEDDEEPMQVLSRHADEQSPIPPR